MQTAVISDCGNYRYLLTRPSEVTRPERGTALFLMLNPSTADAAVDDPTIRRCRGFAKAWGCNGLTVANLFALRSTDPAMLLSHADPIGPLNDDWLRRLAHEYGDVVCAWGAHSMAVGRSIVVAQLLRQAGARLWCLGATKHGFPRHPLYVRSDQPLVEWKAPGNG
ncbi:TPA: DUF1643 domain-containing protein [Stenotrophomonas maltophilia]|jgi:hypothetical protein|uniref:DUF1643 domain-containing protein n=1 Tax=Stenotrophomonas maltophilia TaxID=40324 RepID=UPI000C15AD15|nr:DUF1643 domain-containing protein [Stenotrophomonas maltophilia]QJC73945.1 DUF1643 domain-containing protein [Stenotrophomonas maltophilia]HEP1206998.1 DUF1643 domain-containing protein [Stenotrophomonas maltophilia]